MSDREDKEETRELRTTIGLNLKASPSAWRGRHRGRFPPIRGRDLTTELAALKRRCTDCKFNRRECKSVRAFLPGGERIPSGVRILTDLHADNDNDDRRIHTLHANERKLGPFTVSLPLSDTHRE